MLLFDLQFDARRSEAGTSVIDVKEEPVRDLHVTRM
jgi:hypothetical protein